MSDILITGGDSGLGAAITEALREDGHRVTDYSLYKGFDVRTPIVDHVRALDVLINCAGVNEINWLPAVTDAEWDRVVDTNLKGIFKMTQACLPLLTAARGTVLNIISNAAHVPMRCSAAYNASKAGALMLTRQMARELAPGITVFSISPNRLANTHMSRYIDQRVIKTRGWSYEETRKYQLASLLPGVETPPGAVAEFIAFLLQSKEHHRYLTGCDIPYGA